MCLLDIHIWLDMCEWEEVGEDVFSVCMCSEWENEED